MYIWLKWEWWYWVELWNWDIIRNVNLWGVENCNNGKWCEWHCCNKNCALICDCEWNGWLLGILGLCDRESWAGRIATRMWGMVRLSRTDSLVGGHLIEKWEMIWEKKRNEMWGKVRLSHPNLFWWNWCVLKLIDGLCDWLDYELCGLWFAKIVLKKNVK